MDKLNCSSATAVNKPALESEGRAGKGAFNNIYMNGKEVFKFAVRAVPQVIDEALAMGGLTKDDLDWMVLHQVTPTPDCATSLKRAPFPSCERHPSAAGTRLWPQLSASKTCACVARGL